jgi:hypothetical protein
MVTQGVVTLLIGTCVENQQTLYSRLLDASSYHPICHKSTATLVKRAKELCSSNGDLESELKLLKEVFTINIYPKPLVHNIIARSLRPTTEQTNEEDEQNKIIATIP